MTGSRMELKLEASSTEGIHDFIPVLEQMIEMIKGGYEKDTSQYCASGAGCAYPNGDGSHEFSCVWKDTNPSFEWSITPKQD